MFGLDATPYSLDKIAEKQIMERLGMLEERVRLLRKNGVMSEQTIKAYYGEKRFEQVAESNAIEGSTLSVGETELAVLKGVTITGHDPAFIRDALALDRALARLAELARAREVATDIDQLHEIHGLILGERAGSGMFRNQPVRISGSSHMPPKTWHEVMAQMERWQQWSIEQQALPAPVRATILHAWLAHIHPYIDGNGRTARAISNLELVRAGYPPIIIRKKERARYITALAESDVVGDIRSFLELVFDRLDGALIGLELSARKAEGFNPVAERIRELQERHLQIWNTSLKLLAQTLELRLSEELEAVRGTCRMKYFDVLDHDDYAALCAGRTVGLSWSFIVSIAIPGFPEHETLAWLGHRSPGMRQHLAKEEGPALFWSRKNPQGLEKWVAANEHSPFAIELTTKNGSGDDWHAKKAEGTFEQLNTTSLGRKLARSLLESVST